AVRRAQLAPPGRTLQAPSSVPKAAERALDRNLIFVVPEIGLPVCAAIATHFRYYCETFLRAWPAPGPHFLFPSSNGLVNRSGQLIRQSAWSNCIPFLRHPSLLQHPLRSRLLISHVLSSISRPFTTLISPRKSSRFIFLTDTKRKSQRASC
ncbi:hypothetical protein SISNIDRAFT_430110, partial [Sistotremastrum niveocremeum HHB9708]